MRMRADLSQRRTRLDCFPPAAAKSCYAGLLFDPDGNNVEAVFHGPAHRSAPSVVIDIGDA
jgi:hypothetical protein